MGRSDQLFTAIEAIHRAGIEPERWTAALGAVGEVTGSRAVTIDAFDLGTLRHQLFLGWNMQPLTRSEYLGMGGATNSRVHYAVGHPEQQIVQDADLFADEGELDREPFYANFLAHHDCRYFAAGTIQRRRKSQTFMTLIRSPRQGHVQSGEVEALSRILSHARLALDVTRRLGEANSGARRAEAILDWLPDGVAVLDAGGRVVHANAAFFALIGQRDGLSLGRGDLEFTDTAARRSFDRALARCATLVAGDPGAAPSDFPVHRPSGLPSLVASVRPAFAGEGAEDGAGLAILFLSDPCAGAAGARSILAEAFGLTPAEADMAEALRAGVAPSDYARERGVSINTAYTHLRRLKEKTATRRLPELIHRLKAAAPAARAPL